jgi:hypothetical protein
MSKIKKALLVQSEIPVSNDVNNELDNPVGSFRDYINGQFDHVWKNVYDGNKVLDSVKYQKGLVSYGKPREVFEGVYKILNGVDGVIMYVKGEESDDITSLDGGVFGKYNIEARFEYEGDLPFKYVLGVIIAVDVVKPVVSIYSGIRVRGNNNFISINDGDMIRSSIEYGISYGYLEMMIKELKVNMDRYRNYYEKLKSIPVSYSEICKIVGELMIVDSVKMLSINTAITAGVKEMSNVKSQYYYLIGGFNKWMLLNCFLVYMDSRVSFVVLPERSRDVCFAINNLSVI